MIHLKLDLGIDAQRFIQQVAMRNEILEEQISKGIELALKDISEGDNFIQAIRQTTQDELKNIVNKAVLSWEVRGAISKMVNERLGKKIEEYADKIAARLVSNLEEVPEK